MISYVPSNTDVLILCGGKGRRIQSIAKGRPKSMIDINGMPFLDILIDYIDNLGFKRIVLCIGYRSGFIKKYYSGRKNRLEIVFSEEKELLGTGGAIKNAGPFIKSLQFLVLNGDSFCRIDLQDFLRFHIEKHAGCSMVLTRIESSKDYGAVSLNETGEITAFNEKSKNENNGFINAGIYALNKELLSLIPGGKKFSLEKQLFPGIVNKRFYGYITERPLIDIGVPKRYNLANEMFK